MTFINLPINQSFINFFINLFLYFFLKVHQGNKERLQKKFVKDIKVFLKKKERQYVREH